MPPPTDEVDDLPDRDSGRLISDAQIAKHLSVSPSWPRKQRFNRYNGLPHVLTIDRVLLGGLVRYRIEDFRDWLATLKPEKIVSPSMAADGKNKESSQGLDHADVPRNLVGMTEEESYAHFKSVGVSPTTFGLPQLR